jgi:hypothetical protein
MILLLYKFFKIQFTLNFFIYIYIINQMDVNIKESKLFLFLVVIFIYFVFFHNSENFSGSAVDNPYTNLTCINTGNGNIVAKVSPSLNAIDPKNPHTTIHRLINPNTKKFVELSDMVDPNTPCDDTTFSAAYVKSLTNQDGLTRQLFNKINSGTSTNSNSTWQTVECTAQHLNGSLGNHWCKDVYNVINTDTTCETQNQIAKSGMKKNQQYHRYCDEQENLRKYANSIDLRLGTSADKTFQNYIKNAGRGCTSSCQVSAGAIPQNINDISLKDSKGVPLYNYGGVGGLDIILNKKAEPPTLQQDNTFKNSTYYNKYQNCIQTCAGGPSNIGSAGMV